MVASDHPGSCGTAARLPNEPGSQTLVPPSSAVPVVGASATTPRATQAGNQLRNERIFFAAYFGGI